MRAVTISTLNARKTQLKTFIIIYTFILYNFFFFLLNFNRSPSMRLALSSKPTFVSPGTNRRNLFITVKHFPNRYLRSVSPFPFSRRRYPSRYRRAVVNSIKRAHNTILSRFEISYVRNFYQKDTDRER